MQLAGSVIRGINSRMSNLSPHAATTPWPLRYLPELINAGRFPLTATDFRVQYLSQTHALHLHLYHGVVKIGSETFILAPGDVTLSPARLPSFYDLPGPGQHWCVHFLPPPTRLPAAERVLFPWHIPLGAQREFGIERLRHVSRLFAHGRHGVKSGDPLAAAAGVAAFQETLLWLALVSRTPAGPDRLGAQGERALDQLMTILQTRFTEPLCVADLADEVELTQNYLARRFRERFGMTIPHYILMWRIEHARLLLADTNMPIHRIAQRVGLPDPQHFNKQFRHLTGVSPSRYRAESQRS